MGLVATILLDRGQEFLGAMAFVNLVNRPRAG